MIAALTLGVLVLTGLARWYELRSRKREYEKMIQQDPEHEHDDLFDDEFVF